MTRRELLRWQAQLCDRANALMSRKNQDYATGYDEDGDVFANFRLSEKTTGVPVAVGMLVRLSDKVSRLGQLIKPGYAAQVTDETLEDTVLDIINYAVLVSAFHRVSPTPKIEFPVAGEAVDETLPRFKPHPHCRECD